jgi:transcriptional regulator with XRE-family HTH domain
VDSEEACYYEAVGRRITELRKKHGLTQRDLSRVLGVSQQTVFAYEIGARRILVLTLIKIADVLCVSLEQLANVGRELEPPTFHGLTPLEMHLARRFQRLSKSQQRLLKRLVDALLLCDAAAVTDAAASRARSDHSCNAETSVSRPPA